MLCEYRQHVGRFAIPRPYFVRIATMHFIDECTIPSCCRIEIGAEGAVDERIDYIAKSDKKPEMKIGREQRQNILRANSFETLARTIPVFKQLLIPLQLMVEAMGRRQAAPELVDDVEGFRPSYVAIPSDDIGRDERSMWRQTVLDPAEQDFQIHDMVQRLIGEDGVVFAGWLPLIHVSFDKPDSIANPGCSRC